jgi:hypothetical protein
MQFGPSLEGAFSEKRHPDLVFKKLSFTLSLWEASPDPLDFMTQLRLGFAVDL